MKTTQATRREIIEENGLMEAFSGVSKVGRAEGESPETLRKFKYAMGRNYERCLSIQHEHKKRVENLLRNRPERITELERRKRELMMEHAMKDPDGSFLYEGDENNPQYRFTSDGEKALNAGTDALEAEFAADIAKWENICNGESAWLDERVELRVHAFPFDQLPENLAGGWISRLSFAWTGLPELDDEELYLRLGVVPSASDCLPE